MVLSGYLITMVLVAGGSERGWALRFYRNRAVRPVPALVGVLVVVGALEVTGLLTAEGEFAPSALAALSYVSTWAVARKSFVSGKSVSVRGDVGGRRTLNNTIN